MKQLSIQLREEKKKSCIVVAQLMEKAEVLVSEARGLTLTLARKEKELEGEMSASKEREKEAVREERTWSQRVFAKCKLRDWPFALSCLLIVAPLPTALLSPFQSPVKVIRIN